MLVTGGAPTGIWSSVSLVPGGGAEVVPGSPPAPLIESEPEPLQGRPVIELVPLAAPPIAAVLPGNVPGLIGDTGGSGICCSVKGFDGFCAITSGAAAALGKRNAMGPAVSCRAVGAEAPAVHARTAHAASATIISAVSSARLFGMARSMVIAVVPHDGTGDANL